MALSIINNSTAIGAQGSVNNANNSLTKTIKALSTGLRINSAADDASGLAVSEKLRAQISGLSKAATNAQDAISMLQTAEGAMGSMTSMVQRIRELAVQAGDPAYTANDRAMLQLEVDQLKEEIDRVSSSSEFNTKKLLNGDAAAIWSASTDDIEAIVKGTPVEGNYKISYSVDPGQNSVYKSNIMRLGEGEMSYNINSNGTSITKFDNIQGMLRGTDQTVTVQGSAATTAEAFLAGGTGAFGNTFGTGSAFLTASAATTQGLSNGYSIEMRTVGGNTTNVNYTAGTAFTAGSTVAETLYVEQNGVTYAITAGTSLTASITAASINDTAVTTTFNIDSSTGTFVLQDAISGKALTASQIEYRVRDASTGKISDWAKATVSVSGAVTNDNVTINGQEVDVFGTGVLTIQGGTLGSASFTLNMWESGEKMLVNVGTARASAAGTATIQIGENGTKVHIANATDPDKDKTHTIYTSQMDEAGNVYYGQIDVTLRNGNVVSGTASIDILGTGDVASKYTKLSQLSQFTNADGRMVLDNTQEISIYAGNGNVAKVTLEGSDTIADLESKLNSALVEQLGMGASSDNPNAADINRNLVKFVETPGTGDRAVQGTFVIQGAVLGSDSNLTFVGDESVLAGLGVTQIQQASDSALNVVVSDAHTGEYIGEDTVTDGRLRNVIQGVDLDIVPSSAADVSFDTTTNSLVFQGKTESTEAFLHIKDNATKAAIGANEGQVLDISIGRLDTKSMGIDDVNVATFDDAQKSITKLDMALEQISAARATAGAQMNRLEYTINNLNTTRENMVAAESRIRDLDIAQASSDLAAQQVVMQAATAMLAQANMIPSYAMQLLG